MRCLILIEIILYKNLVYVLISDQLVCIITLEKQQDDNKLYHVIVGQLTAASSTLQGQCIDEQCWSHYMSLAIHSVINIHQAHTESVNFTGAYAQEQI